MTKLEVTVTDAPDRARYEASTADGELAGVAQYILAGNSITFTHTETVPAFEGRGVASQLARFALRDAKRRGLQIVPMCPYIKKWIFEHPDYAADL